MKISIKLTKADTMNNKNEKTMFEKLINICNGFMPFLIFVLVAIIALRLTDSHIEQKNRIPNNHSIFSNSPVNIVNIDSLISENKEKIISDNYISYKAFLNANTMYQEKYSALKKVYENIVLKIGVLITVLLAITGVIVGINFKSVGDAKKDIQKTKEEIENAKEEIDAHNKRIEDVRETAFKNIATCYFVSARAYFDIAKEAYRDSIEYEHKDSKYSKQKMDFAKIMIRHHFFYLKAYFEFVAITKLELRRKSSLNNLKLLRGDDKSEKGKDNSDKFIEFYKLLFPESKEFFEYSLENTFLNSLGKFENYCKNKGEGYEDYCDEIKKIFEELRVVFKDYDFDEAKAKEMEKEKTEVDSRNAKKPC